MTAKVEKARCEGIILRPAVAIYNEVQIDFLDLVLILGNVLDNAIEATMQVFGQNKVINLSIRLQGDFLILEVKNPVKEKVRIENNNIATSKADTTMHGLGLENIKILIKKYNGAMYLQCTETTFTLKALLQNECVKNNENY